MMFNLKAFRFYLLFGFFISHSSFAEPAHTFSIGGADIEIHFTEPVKAKEERKLLEWIRYGGKVILQVYGEFPRESFLIYIHPVGPYNEVVPWGEVKRYPTSAMHLHVDQTRPLKEMINDWTLAHEFGHTLHPYLGREGRWLSEGLASYYQNVLQARVGTLTPERAWLNLHRGFERGKQQIKAGEILKRTSMEMRKNHKYMRVYWTGAAYWLNVDWRLRTQYDSSLDEVLKRFRHCCLRNNLNWSPTKFVNKLDALSGTELFSNLYQDYAHSDEFPHLEQTYKALGIKASYRKINFDKNARDYELIEAIMRKHG